VGGAASESFAQHNVNKSAAPIVIERAMRMEDLGTAGSADGKRPSWYPDDG